MEQLELATLRGAVPRPLGDASHHGGVPGHQAVVVAGEPVKGAKVHTCPGRGEPVRSEIWTDWAPIPTPIVVIGTQIGGWRRSRPDSGPGGGGWGWVATVGLSVMSDRTLVLFKPDAVERGLVGTILARFEAKGLRLVTLDHRMLDDDTLSRHYAEHVGKPFYADLVAFMSRGPVVALVLEGPENTWEVVRTMMGTTNPRNAAPGTIRGDLGIQLTENLVHGSDSLESAAREVSIFFPDL